MLKCIMNIPSISMHKIVSSYVTLVIMPDMSACRAYHARHAVVQNPLVAQWRKKRAQEVPERVFAVNKNVKRFVCTCTLKISTTETSVQQLMTCLVMHLQKLCI